MIPRSFAASVIALATLAALATIGALPLAAAEDARATRTPRPTPSPTPGCVVTATHKADPDRLAVGEETTATVHLEMGCSIEPDILHVVFVLDGTSAVEGEALARELSVVEQLTTALLGIVTVHDQIEIGVVGFGDHSRFQCSLTNDPRALEHCWRRLQGLNRRDRGEESLEMLDRALADARTVMRRGRGARDLGAIREVMTVLANGPGTGSCLRSLRVARLVKRDGILLMTVCLGSSCDATCLRQIASSARYFFQVDNAGGLIAAFTRIRDERLSILLKRLTLRYVPAGGMVLVPGSAQPEATVLPDGSQVDWLTNYVPRDGVTATLRLRALTAGRAPLAREAGGTWVDNANRPGAFVVPAVEVEVADRPASR